MDSTAEEPRSDEEVRDSAENLAMILAASCGSTLELGAAIVAAVQLYRQEAGDQQARLLLGVAKRAEWHHTSQEVLH